MLSWTDAGLPVALAAVAASAGSAPRGAGARMAVRADGLSVGSVGGGVLEARALEAARAVLASGEPVLLDMELSGEQAAGAGMLCGGRVRVLVERVLPGPEAEVFAVLLGRLEQGSPCVLATPLTARGEGRLVLDPAAPLPSSLAGLVSGTCSDPSRAAILDGWPVFKSPALVEASGRAWLLETWRGPRRLFIAGAGHVGLATARVAALTGFEVTVMDDRPEFLGSGRFPDAVRTRAVPLESCLDGLSIGEADCVLIVTRGHLHDARVLAQALRTRAGYVGMIGSRRKRDAVYAMLEGQGVPRALLEGVRCPVGLPIGASTPEEIAVSVVAELIAFASGLEGS